MTTTTTTPHAHAHIVPVRTYLTIYFILMGLLFLTIAAALVDLGPFQFTAAMLIALVKGILIVLYFMHVRYSERLTWIFSGASFLWLLILIAFTLNDYLTRGWLNVLGK
jgi:cytochrome c oxidase subunit 4